jgi:predicted dehydrogenase
MRKYRIGVIGLGGMGFRFLRSFAVSDRWEPVWVCDLNPERLARAAQVVPSVKTTEKSADLAGDPSLDAVAICTLADIRPTLMREALAGGKHIIAEKPIAASIAEERALLEDIERSGRVVAVNIFNRNAWYHDEIRAFIREGQIGRPAIISISHQTPGLMPTEGHGPEGPPFHDCGMHYVDVARWYAESEYDQWHAQGMRMWGWKDPWWINAHGTFRNGIVFDITQGFVYGHRAQKKTNRCGLEVIGTKGIVRMRHDMSTVRIEYFGTSCTGAKEGLYGDKKTDVMCVRFAEALDTGDTSRLPSARDSVIASEVSQAMLDASRDTAPIVGTPEEMQEILAIRAKHRAETGRWP